MNNEERELKAEMLHTLSQQAPLEAGDASLGGRLGQTKGFVESNIRRVVQVLKARWYLRQCQLTGLSKVNGRVCVRQYGGLIQIHNRVLLDGIMVPIELVTRKGGRLEIGKNTYINYGTSISASKLIQIGEKCLIGTYNIIIDDDFHGIVDRDDPPPPEPIILEDNVWLGARVTVLKGVTIGHDSVIGAGSVVNKSIPPRSVAVGLPARVIKTF